MPNFVKLWPAHTEDHSNLRLKTTNNIFELPQWHSIYSIVQWWCLISSPNQSDSLRDICKTKPFFYLPNRLQNITLNSWKSRCAAYNQIFFHQDPFKLNNSCVSLPICDEKALICFCDRLLNDILIYYTKKGEMASLCVKDFSNISKQRQPDYKVYVLNWLNLWSTCILTFQSTLNFKHLVFIKMHQFIQQYLCQ